MEEKKCETDRIRADVVAKRNAMGLKFTRHLNNAEGREFLASGRVPADALSPSTFIGAKNLSAMPESVCMVCGDELAGKPGWIVQINTPTGKRFDTVCDIDYNAVVATATKTVPAVAAPTPTPTPSVPPVAPVAPVAKPAAAPADPVSAALAALTNALTEAKAEKAKPQVDESKLVAEAVKAARDEAKAEAKAFMQQTLADIFNGGVASAASVAKAEAAPEAEKPKAAAKGDGVAAAEKASGWTAKATPAAKDAVEKLNKFLSEFSYFRNGVSMRLVNTFARAADKKAALQSYCEVSQMEDAPDLIEKMKSPEFAEVVKAFAALKKTPEPVNKRFAVFYGNPGGGKTYAAEVACKAINGDGKADMVICHAGMDSADMLYAYRLDYQTGKRGYVPTALLNAMVNGRAVVLDEVNTLPMEARMFLQDILDNKGRVHVMGVEIPIKDGFFVIGTMNPETGQGAQPLPLPLVDRAAVVREFRTSASQCAVGAGLC